MRRKKVKTFDWKTYPTIIKITKRRMPKKAVIELIERKLEAYENGILHELEIIAMEIRNATKRDKGKEMRRRGGAGIK